jgi:hypothetical protein
MFNGIIVSGLCIYRLLVLVFFCGGGGAAVRAVNVGTPRRPACTFVSSVSEEHAGCNLGVRVIGRTNQPTIHKANEGRKSRFHCWVLDCV